MDLQRNLEETRLRLDDCSRELNATRRELASKQRELEFAQDEERDWERRFSEFAGSVLKSSQAAEDAARSMYETMWDEEQKALISYFQSVIDATEEKLNRVQIERNNAMKSAVDANDALESYRAQEPDRAKEARRELAARFGAEKERIMAANQLECQRLAGESRALREKLERQAAERSGLETRASELALALERQKKETEKARLKIEEVRKCQERIRILEDFIRTQGERDLARENENLAAGLRQSEERAEKLRSLYEKSLVTLRDLNSVKQENSQLREIATRVTLDNSKNAVEVQFLRGQLAQAERTMQKMTENIEKMSVAIMNSAEDRFIVEQNAKLRERVTEERKSSKECQAKLFEATQRFERELEKERAKNRARVLPTIQN